MTLVPVSHGKQLTEIPKPLIQVGIVGKPAQSHQRKVIFVNGIETPIEKAQDQAKAISGAFGGRAVTLVHNPTKYAEYFNSHPRMGDNTPPECTALENEVVATLVEKIRTNIGDATKAAVADKHRVVLMAHSHGTHILFQALKQLTDDERQCVSAHAFGGITMIPKVMALTVENHINECDIIGITGNRAYDTEGTLAKFLTITQLMRKNKLDVTRAIIHQVTQDFHDRMDPFAQSVAMPKDLKAAEIAKFGAIFFGNEQVDPAHFKQCVESYTKCFSDYDIRLIPPPAAREAGSRDASLDVEEIARAVAQGLGAFVTDSDSKCHILNNFMEAIKVVADRTKTDERRKLASTWD